MTGLIGFILSIAILIFVHEWGHYIVARLCGVPVLAFSLGFGPIVFKHTDKSGCEWRLSALPLGGYVKMLTLEEKPDLVKEFPARHFDWAHAVENTVAWRRFLIVLAGPAMNLIFAVFLYWGMAIQGGYEVSPRVGVPIASSEAARAGVEAGWTIKKVGETPVATFREVRKLLKDIPAGKTVSVYFTTDSGSSRWVDFRALEEDSAKYATPFGLTPFIESVIVGRVEPDSAAEEAGIKAGETILSINGKSVGDAHAVIGIIRASAGKPLVFRLREAVGGEERTLSVTPRLARLDTGEEVLRIGATLASLPATVYVSYGPIEALGVGFRQTSAFVALTVGSFARLVVGEESLKSLGGPVAIGNIAGKTLSLGIAAFVNFLAALSISLGILNLLPVPVLDGGHILLNLWEMATGIRPSKAVYAILNRIGLAFILCLMGLALFNDFMNLL